MPKRRLPRFAHTHDALRFSATALAAALCCTAAARAQTPDADTALPAVTVTAPAEVDLREPRRRTDAGPLGERELLDTPYAITAARPVTKTWPPCARAAC